MHCMQHDAQAFAKLKGPINGMLSLARPRATGR